METDAEAGGAPPSLSEIEMERRAMADALTDKGSNATARERSPDGSAKKNGRHPFMTALVLIILRALIVVAAVSWMG